MFFVTILEPSKNDHIVHTCKTTINFSLVQTVYFNYGKIEVLQKLTIINW
jgi:hypothetical protein